METYCSRIFLDWQDADDKYVRGRPGVRLQESPIHSRSSSSGHNWDNIYDAKKGSSPSSLVPFSVISSCLMR